MEEEILESTAGTAEIIESNTTSLLDFVFESVYFQIGSIVLAGLFAIFIIAVAYWVFRDIRSRTNNKVAWIVSVLFILIFNVIGVLFYTLLRPQKTIQEKEVEKLEKQLLKEEMEKSGTYSSDKYCKSCGEELKDQYSYCPD